MSSLAMVALSGCVSVFEGTSQDISVNTNPPGARCDFFREEKSIGSVLSSPGTLTVRKSKYDITIRCAKPGYQEATHVNPSGTSAAIAANIAVDILLTAGISSIVDSANGADNKYDDVVDITLLPEGAVAAMPASYAGSVLSGKTLYVGTGTEDAQVDYFATDGTLRRRQGECVVHGVWKASATTVCTRLEKERLDTCLMVGGSPATPEFYDPAQPATPRFTASRIGDGDADNLTTLANCSEHKNDDPGAPD